MRFLVDEQLPPALARWLEAKGHTAEHLADLGLLGLSDADVARRAMANRAVVGTKDEDYVAFGVRVEQLQVLWLRVGNVSNRTLFVRLEAAWSEVASRLARGDLLVTVLSDSGLEPTD